MKRLLPIAILFALLLALVVAKEMARPHLDESAAEIPLAAQKFVVEDVAKVEVTAPGGSSPAYVVERKGETWEMTSPFRAPAHIGNVEKLCEGLATGDVELRADDAEMLRTFDLVPERSVQVRLTDAQGKVLAEVGVGGSTGTSGAFVRLLSQAGDVRGFETTTNLRGLLGLGRSGTGDSEPEAPKPAHFRDRDFPAVKLDTPKRIEITAPGRRVVFEKKGDMWAVAEGGPGAGAAVNDTGIKQLLEHIGPEFQAKDLADPSDLAKLGLAEPKHVVAITLEDGSVKRILGAGDPSRDAYHVRLDAKQDPDVVYEATSWEWQRLFPTGVGLFTFENVDIPDETLTRIVVERSVETSGEKDGDKGAERIELTREGTKPTDDWEVVVPDTSLVPRQSSLRSLGSLVRNVKAIDWIDGTDAGTIETTIRAGAKDAGDADLATLRIGGKSPTGKDRLAILPKHPDRVFVLADSTVDRLSVSSTSLFEARVFHGWTLEDLKSVRVEKPDGAGWTPEFALENGEKGWTLVRGEERKDTDGVSTNKWLGALLGLETQEPDATSAAAAADEWSITVEKNDGTTRRFLLSAAKDGKRAVTVGTLRFPTDRTDLVAWPEPKKD